MKWKNRLAEKRLRGYQRFTEVMRGVLWECSSVERRLLIVHPCAPGQESAGGDPQNRRTYVAPLA
jgi:hypothetical protein